MTHLALVSNWNMYQLILYTVYQSSDVEVLYVLQLVASSWWLLLASTSTRTSTTTRAYGSPISHI